MPKGAPIAGSGTHRTPGSEAALARRIRRSGAGKRLVPSIIDVTLCGRLGSAPSATAGLADAERHLADPAGGPRLDR